MRTSSNPRYARSLRFPLELAKALLVVTALLFLPSAKAEAEAGQEEATRLVQALQSEDPRFFFDMHGNANETLVRLMQLRFEATAAIQNGIDRVEGKSRYARQVDGLYHVLGFVKDPAAIPWLENKLRLPATAKAVNESYMPGWHYGVGVGFSSNQEFGEWPWLNGREQWIAFFIRAFASAKSVERRMALANVLKGFENPVISQLFLKLRVSATDDREVLFVEAYLHQHGIAADGTRIAQAIDALDGNSQNRELLLGTADALRHEAFVPYLIKTANVADQFTYPPSFSSRFALQKITFQLDIEEKKNWQAWYAKHRGESREQWVVAALQTFRGLLTEDPATALKRFRECNVYRWNDMSVLPIIMRDLLPRPEFASAIAGWINLTYTAAYRPQLQPIAEELAKHPERLDDWAKRLLQQRGFLPQTQRESWDDYVRISNSAL